MIYRNCCQWFKKCDFEINTPAFNFNGINTVTVNFNTIEWIGLLTNLYGIQICGNMSFVLVLSHLQEIKWRFKGAVSRLASSHCFNATYTSLFAMELKKFICEWQN